MEKEPYKIKIQMELNYIYSYILKCYPGGPKYRLIYFWRPSPACSSAGQICSLTSSSPLSSGPSLISSGMEHHTRISNFPCFRRAVMKGSVFHQNSKVFFCYAKCWWSELICVPCWTRHLYFQVRRRSKV